MLSHRPKLPKIALLARNHKQKLNNEAKDGRNFPKLSECFEKFLETIIIRENSQSVIKTLFAGTRHPIYTIITIIITMRSVTFTVRASRIKLAISCNTAAHTESPSTPARHKSSVSTHILPV